MSAPSLARRFLAVLDPPATAPMFAAETYEELSALGLSGMATYFCSRAAPLGAVPAEVVIATFYNWNPDMIRREVRWNPPAPQDTWEARVRGARRTLQRALGEAADDPGIARAATLLREAASASPLEGRPLFAAHASMPWPEEPLLQFWFGATLLREFRGDTHIAVLLAHGIGPIEALLLNSQWIDADREKYLGSREWTLADAEPATRRLMERAFMSEDGSLTEGGMKFREMIEVDTDRRSAAPVEALGPDRCEEALRLIEPVAKKLIEVKAVPRLVGRTARGARLV